MERKNPLGVIEAFRRAFHPGEPVRLVIKCANAAIDPAALHALRERARGYQIEIAVGLWSPQEMADLYAACDAYVSLHRAEGTGLTLAEAMAHGKPVIATGWSGNTDFMHAGNSFPVGYELVTLPEDVGPYEQGAVWADPSIEEAADLMRLVVADPDEADKRGVAAARDVAAFFAVGRIAGLIERRLGEIARLRGDSVTASVPPQGLEP